MDKSSEIGQITEALSKAQGAMAMAKKDSDNPFYHSVYADLASVWEVARKPLADNGLAVIQGASFEDGKVKVSTILAHSSGEYFENELTLIPMTTEIKDVGRLITPQTIGSAITYGRRYSLSSILGIASEEDDDGNAASGNKAGKKVQEQPTGQPTPVTAANSIKGGTCPLHNVQFFKAGKMKAFAHKTEDGSWCNMPEPTKTTPEQNQQNKEDIFDNAEQNKKIQEAQTASKINVAAPAKAKAVVDTAPPAADTPVETPEPPANLDLWIAIKELVEEVKPDMKGVSQWFVGRKIGGFIPSQFNADTPPKNWDVETLKALHEALDKKRKG